MKGGVISITRAVGIRTHKLSKGAMNVRRWHAGCVPGRCGPCRKGETMEPDLLKLLAQFRILMKKERGTNLDLEKLMNDAAYARQACAQAEESENETLVMVSIALREKLGFLKTAAKPAAEKEPEPTKGKYMYGARS